MEIKQTMAKAEEILRRRFARSGLMGVPIWAAGHFTLLIFRNLFGQPTQIRYYDSLKEPQKKCIEVAQKIVDLLCPGQILTKSNQAVQKKYIDCGIYVLHYWEGEMLRFLGCGWQMPWPQATKEIKARRSRLV